MFSQMSRHEPLSFSLRKSSARRLSQRKGRILQRDFPTPFRMPNSRVPFVPHSEQLSLPMSGRPLLLLVREQLRDLNLRGEFLCRDAMKETQSVANETNLSVLWPWSFHRPGIIVRAQPAWIV